MRNFLEEKVEFCISIAGKRYTAARFTGRWWWWCWFLSEHIGNSTFRAGGHRRTDKVSGSSDPKILNKGKPAKNFSHVFCSSWKVIAWSDTYFFDRAIKFCGKFLLSQIYFIPCSSSLHMYNMIGLYLRKKMLFLSVCKCNSILRVETCKRACSFPLSRYLKREFLLSFSPKFTRSLMPKLGGNSHVQT